jgi:hypothetical protein
VRRSKLRLAGAQISDAEMTVSCLYSVPHLLLGLE